MTENTTTVEAPDCADQTEAVTDKTGNASAATSTDHMIPKARLDQEVKKRRAIEGSLSSIAEDIVTEEVPEKFRDLVPDTLSALDLIAWVRKAKEKGIFDDPAPIVPETDQSKPKTTPRDQDLSNLPLHSRMAAGYGKTK